MGHSSEAIFMKPRITVEQELSLLKKLGLDNFVFKEKVWFEETMTSSRRNGVYIGHCNDSTFIVFDGVVANYIGFIKDEFNPWEKILSSLYPNSAFLSILNFEGTCSYQYHYFKDAETVRKKAGVYPKLLSSIGEELEIEKEYYVKKETIDGQEIFFTKPWNEHETELHQWTHAQIGGEVAFRLVKIMAEVEYGHDFMFNSLVNQYLPNGELSIIGAWGLDKKLFQKYPALIPPELIGQGIIDEKVYEPTPKQSLSSNSNASNPIHINYPSGFHPVDAPISITGNVEISASPEKVWEVLIQIKNWDEWHLETYNIQIVSTDIGELKYRSKFRWNTLGVHLLSQVNDFEPSRKISWMSRGTGISSFHAWQLIPTEQGTKVIVENTQKGWLCQLHHRLWPQRMVAYHVDWLERLSKRVLQND